MSHSHPSRLHAQIVDCAVLIVFMPVYSERMRRNSRGGCMYWKSLGAAYMLATFSISASNLWLNRQCLISAAAFVSLPLFVSSRCSLVMVQSSCATRSSWPRRSARTSTRSGLSNESSALTPHCVVNYHVDLSVFVSLLNHRHLLRLSSFLEWGLSCVFNSSGSRNLYRERQAVAFLPA